MFPSTFGGATASTSSAFGRPAATGFNPPVFGSTPTNNLFGGATTQPSGSLFGSNTTAPAFGQTQSTQPAFGGFTASSSGTTSLFGTQQNASTSGGLFGSNTTQAFGQPKPSFGFVNTQTPGLFGQQQQQSSLFGQPATQSATGLFGSTPGFGATPSATGGTTIKFTPVSGTDTMMKNGASTSVNIRHHCITCMKEYENKSLEELRLEDYVAGRKGSQQNAQSGGLFGATNQPTLFGPTTSTSGSLFGTENKSLFGTPNQGFGSTAGSNMFGGTNTSNSLFGKPAGTATPFGAPATTATNSFGFNNTSTNLFGSNTAQKPFGNAAPQTGGLFGNLGTSQPSTGFGTQSTGFGGGFGNQPAQNGGLFGGKPAFNLGGNTSTGFSFNQPASTSTTSSLFGAKPATTGFGTGFGTATSTSTFGPAPFGQTNQNVSPFGASNFNKPTGFNFGPTQPNTSLGLNLGGGTSLFNNPASKPGGLFGQTNTGGGLFSGGFGSTNTFNTGSNLVGGISSQPAMGSGIGSGLNSLGGQSTQNPISQHLNAYSSIPFGHSPLFKNLLEPTGKADELLIKPTSPAAQKALISGQNYKISPKNSSKIKMKPVEASGISKKSLFDGLDGDEDLTQDFLSPITRPTPKRLVVQSRPFVDTPIAQSSFLVEKSNAINEMSPVIKTSPRLLFITRNLNETRENRLHEEKDFESRSPKMNRLQDNNNSLVENKSGSNQKTVGSPSVDNKDTAASIASSSDSDLEDTIPAEVDGTMLDHPAGIVLRRAGYYTIPSLDELAKLLAADGSCVVDNFTVGRLNYGNVFYPDSFNVAGLNLDEIVHFRHKEVVVYPDDEKKPPVGMGLNRRAQVTLDRVWPIDKSTRLPITDPCRIADMDYETKLTRASAKHGTRFVEYRPQTGSWVFKVDHFSKYGLSDSDEEDDVPSGVKKLKKDENGASLIGKNIPSSTPLQLPKAENKLVSRAVLLAEEDEEMDDGITSPLDLGEDLEFTRSPTSKLAKEMGTSSHKVQLMKASFFDVDGEELDIEDLDQPPIFQVNGTGFDAKKMAQALSWYKKSEFVGAYSNSEPEFDPRPVMESERVPPSLDDDSIDHEMIEQVIAQPIHPKRYILRCKGFLPMSKLLKGVVDSGCLSEMSIFKGRNCQVGWGPGSRMIVHSTAPCSEESHYFPSLPKNTELATDSFSPTVCYNNLFSLEESEVSFKDTVEQHLHVAYKQTVFNLDGNSPSVTPKIGVGNLHRYNRVAANLAEGFSSDQFLRNSATIWSLCSALWGDLEDISPDSHSCLVQRKMALSDWLENVLADEVSKEANLVGNSAAVYSYLTGHKIAEACEEAHKLGDYQLSLLINRCGSGEGAQNIIKKQMSQWRDTQADNFVDPSRLKCLMLAAGLKVHNTSGKVLNSCQDLSWLRAFALHLWYFTPLSSSITDALVDYEKSFTSAEDENYASPPYPSFIDEYAVESSKKPLYDVRYHLLKLFSAKSYPLEQLFNPNAITPDALDYRLSWFLLRVMTELGYSHVNGYSAAIVHTSFASQLEAQGLWHWAVFVVLHHPNDKTREALIKDLLERHANLDDNDEIEHFILNDLHIPSDWVYQAKATKAIVNQRYNDAAKYLLKAGNWNESHNVIMRYISSIDIVNNNYDHLEGLLKELAVENRWKDVAGWKTGGEVVLEYLEVAKEVEQIVAAQDPNVGYHLERLQPQLKDLCLRIKLMKADSPLDMLSRAEMAKRTADLMLNLVLSHCGDDSHQGLNVLSHLIHELPLTSDYAQQEWKAVLASWLNNLAHSDIDDQQMIK